MDELLDKLMSEALREANVAFSAGEVPIGAVIAHKGEIIAGAHNRVEHDLNVLSHAELSVIRDASFQLKNWRLSECILCVTLEPCVMCMGAIRLARIGTIFYGAGDSRQGALGSTINLSEGKEFGPPPLIIQSMRRNECQELLRSFFEKQRGRAKAL